MKPRIDMELLREYHEGLIALSACLAGKIPQLILSGSMQEAEKCALEMKSIFGDDFYLEIQNHGIDDELKVAFGIKMLSSKLGIPMVATNDVHYVDRTDADTQAALLCIQTNTCISDGRPFGFDGNEFYFKTTQLNFLFWLNRNSFIFNFLVFFHLFLDKTASHFACIDWCINFVYNVWN